ncbi:permease component of ABC-type sugar transporter [Sphaerochaeta pleomorpha str. Grapes]|uniref:Permease component of ABC-type sugar transporter n=1 Tax=Sphaerochaeta pleomorpha (strain ATCC BAA-1885 / DSM 22778 / Grapes) TaxID=158190 RepID=G8QWY4_SPHPG|nr:sugar ABC transporter permease [Sphaerochaeta pleomorpha]AEV29488.1 permease component of ABC-type sugar transporter [Sphaerochaeta pleomorpha str. Grapes]
MKKQTVKIKKETFDSYILIAPLLLLLAVFILYPVIANVYLSFFKWKGMGHATFIGLANYRAMLKDETFWISIKNTLVLLLYIPLGVIVPVMVSAFLREGLKGWPVFRAIIYLPNILGYVIIGMISSIIFRKIGPLNAGLTSLGLGSFALDWLSKPKLALNSLGLVYGVWIRLGFGCIFFLAAMSSIDDSLYDAAKIDGALWWRTFWNVTIPSIRFSIEFWIVLSFIEILARAFPFIYTFTRGGPGFATFTLEYGIYNAGFVAFNMGYASTWASVLFVFCAIIALFQVKLMRKNADVQ